MTYYLYIDSGRIKDYIFLYEYPVVTIAWDKKAILYPLNHFGPSVKKKKSIDYVSLGLFWTCHTFPLKYLSYKYYTFLITIAL